MLSHTQRAVIWNRNYQNGDNLRSSITYLEDMLKLIKAKTVFEIGCGQSHIWDIPDIDYVGADFCGDLIDDNKRNHPDVAFIRYDALKQEVPASDVIIAKDLFECLPNDEVRAILQKIYSSGSKWLIASTNPQVKDKPNTDEGIYRPINLQLYGVKLVMVTRNDLALFELSRKKD
jgi:trans-aconitate methyltransferase